MTGGIHLDVVIAAAAAAGAYFAAWRAAGERIRPARAGAFVGALAALLVALNGPIHDLAESALFSAHMIQHLLLTLVVPPLPYAARILYLFVFGIPMTIVAALITGAEQTLYIFYTTAPRVSALTPVADQRLGGILMWVPAGLVPLLAFTAIFFRWAASEAED